MKFQYLGLEKTKVPTDGLFSFIHTYQCPHDLSGTGNFYLLQLRSSS